MKRHFITDETDSYTTDRLIATLCLSYFKRLNEDRSTHLIIIPLLIESAWMGPLWKEETELISPQVWQHFIDRLRLSWWTSDKSRVETTLSVLRLVGNYTSCTVVPQFCYHSLPRDEWGSLDFTIVHGDVGWRFTGIIYYSYRHHFDNTWMVFRSIERKT